MGRNDEGIFGCVSKIGILKWVRFFYKNNNFSRFWRSRTLRSLFEAERILRDAKSLTIISVFSLHLGQHNLIPNNNGWKKPKVSTAVDAMEVEHALHEVVKLKSYLKTGRGLERNSSEFLWRKGGKKVSKQMQYSPQLLKNPIKERIETSKKQSPSHQRSPSYKIPPCRK